jgi:SAM-dependent methyltransferase
MKAYSSAYSSAFYTNQRAGSLNSAEVVVPLLIEVFRPNSMLDVGCGQGTWSKTAMDLGIGDLIGVDGAWARSALAIPEDVFRSFDLSCPFDLGRRFDLVISMEVGEHIPASCAVTFVNNLVCHSDAVVFSAAIPLQGGTHHLNERWPSYWTSIFMERGYRCFDFLRWKIWNDHRVETWYRQNVLIFAKTSNSQLIGRLDDLSREPMPGGIAVVHPEIWTAMMNSKSLRLQRALDPALRHIRAFFPRTRTGREHSEHHADQEKRR